MDDLLNEFLTETAESIDVVDVELVKLEQDPNNKEVLDNIFRLVHTIKGTCGFLGLPRLESVAHASENVLGKFRDGELVVNEHAVTVILESLDRIKEILAGLEATEEEPQGDDSELIGKLDAIAAGEAGGAAVPAAAEELEEDTLDGEIVDPGLGRTLKPGEVSLEELERAFNDAPGPVAEEESPAPAASAPSGGDSGKADHSLYDRIGGEDTLAVVAHLIATRLEHSAKLKEFFAGVSIDQRKGKVMGLMLALYKDDIDAAETVARQMIAKGGFEESHFAALLELVKTALTECQVDGDIVDEAVMTFELIRDAILSSAKALAQSAPAQGREGDSAQAGAAAAAAGGAAPRSNQSIRVSVDLLEDLMNMVSELVLTRNQLLQIVRNIDNSELAVPLQRLSQCTTELQENVMKTRMQPIGNAWAKLPRIVRDLSVELDKKINLDMRGAETELDRQVLELIKDPLTHMVRNSADHGVESPAERIASGKSETGTIVLNAYHEGGHIIMEIRDDGRGIAVSKLKNKILEKGLASESELAEMSDNQVQKFIFHPGFSTAAQITNVSGRGVGMDVVRSNIEKIGGTIDMMSLEGKGTTFQIKIPLTLAIVAALIVEASGERYAVPQISVLELVRAQKESDNRIETINDTPVLRLRNRLLPLIYLNEILGFSNRSDENFDAEDGFIIVSQVGNNTFGIVVDQVFDTEEIVVKPVAPILKDLEIYSGNTILGDGSVIMILDPNGIASATNATGDDVGNQEEEAQAEVRTLGDDEKESMLLFRAGSDQPKAVPLAVVARLEDIDVDKIEHSDGRHVVQYRGSLMPIIKAEDGMDMKSEGSQPVLVFSDRNYTMGLAVDEILDIIEERMDIKLASGDPAVVGSAVINDQATEVIDVAHFLSLAFSDWHDRREADDAGQVQGASVLLIDDSDFFRSMLRPVLTVAGYQVTAVNSAQSALNMREEGVMFDAIVSDIEMPEMSGFEFAQIVKSGGTWQDTPLIALSSLANERDINRGREAGFDDYLAKFDKETLLRCLAQQMKIQGDAA